MYFRSLFFVSSCDYLFSEPILKKLKEYIFIDNLMSPYKIISEKYKTKVAIY